MRYAAAVRIALAVWCSAAAACTYADPLAVEAPELDGAQAIAFAIFDGTKAELDAYPWSAESELAFSRDLPSSGALEVALLAYSQSLATLEIPEGRIEIPAIAPSTGRPLPFERGYHTVVRSAVERWIELDAVPSWLSSVHVPELSCPEVQAEVFTLGQPGQRVTALAGDGTRAIVALSPGSYYAITATSVDERPLLLPRAVRPQAAATRIDGRIVIAGLDTRADRTGLWIGTATMATFRPLRRLNREMRDVELEVGRSEEDLDEVFIMGGAGDIMHLEGTTMKLLRAVQTSTEASGDRHRVAWVRPHTVAVFGPERDPESARTVTLINSMRSTSTTYLPAGEAAFSLQYLPQVGTALAGTTTGLVYALDGDRWQQLGSNTVYGLSLLSFAIFRGELAATGSSGVLTWRRESSPCFTRISGASASVVVPLGEGLLAANRGLGDDPVLVRVR